jgi:hypothetical protein
VTIPPTIPSTADTLALPFEAVTEPLKVPRVDRLAPLFPLILPWKLPSVNTDADSLAVTANDPASMISAAALPPTLMLPADWPSDQTRAFSPAMTLTVLPEPINEATACCPALRLTDELLPADTMACSPPDTVVLTAPIEETEAVPVVAVTGEDTLPKAETDALRPPVTEALTPPLVLTLASWPAETVADRLPIVVTLAFSPTPHRLRHSPRPIQHLMSENLRGYRLPRH